jgi:hypothetical protein
MNSFSALKAAEEDPRYRTEAQGNVIYFSKAGIYQNIEEF